MTAEYMCHACNGWHDIPADPARGNVINCIANLTAERDAALARAEAYRAVLQTINDDCEYCPICGKEQASDYQLGHHPKCSLRDALEGK